MVLVEYFLIFFSPNITGLSIDAFESDTCNQNREIIQFLIHFGIQFNRDQSVGEYKLYI